MTDRETYAVIPVGVVRSSLTRLEAAPRQGNEGAPAASIEIEPAARAALDGIAVGDELVVVTWFHRARRDVLVTHPRNDPDLPLTGVFATRSPERPNPLGLHRVTVQAVTRTGLEVHPLEAIDGTPVVDLKPVLDASNDA